jgi:vitamin B12 transporter
MIRTVFLCCCAGFLFIFQPLTAFAEDDLTPINFEKGKINNSNEESTEINSEDNGSSLIQFGEIKEDQIFSQSNIPEDIRTSGNSVSVINLKDIRDSNAIEVRNLINTLPGISLYSNGSTGSASPFYMRGWKKSLITVDGVRVNDPNWNQPYLDNILTDGIDRIEVVRGPQGSLHGTQAQGGLMSIYTRQGRGPLSIEAGSTMGSFGTFKENLAIQGERKNLDYYLGITRLDTNGGMKTNVDKRHDNDGYNNYSIASNVGARILDGKAEIRNILRYSAAHKEIGQFGPYLSYDPENDSYTNDLVETLKFSHAPTNWYNYDVKLGLYDNRLKSDNPRNTSFMDEYAYYSKNHNTRLSFDTQHNILYKKINTFTYGYNFEYNKLNNLNYSDSDYNLWTYGVNEHTINVNKHVINNDVYFHDVVNIKDIVFLRGGTRITNSSIWGTYASPDASIAVLLPTFKIPDAYTKLRSSYGHSINTPTLTQLYNIDWGGNPNLKPEKVEGWDIGFTQSFFNEKILFDGSYFNNSHKNLIVNDYSQPYPWQFQNISQAKTYGYETSLKLNPFQKLSMDLNYTYTKTANDSGELYYIPRNRLNFLVNYQPHKRIGIYTRGTTSSSRRGQNLGTDLRLNGFADVGVGTKILLAKRKNTDLYLSAELNNVGNSHYQEVYGYHQPGLNFCAGIFLKKTFEKDEKL